MFAVQDADQAVVIARRPPDQSREERLGAIIIPPAAADRSASERIEDVLARVPSLQSFRRSDSRASNPSAQGLTLRGLGGNASSRTLVLLDGVPVADPFFGYVPLTALDPSRLSEISVLRGAGGGAFGSAVAGTIALESVMPDARAPWDTAVGLSPDGATEAAFGAATATGSTRLSFDASWDRGRGFWTTPRDQRVPASARAAYNARLADVRLVQAMNGGALDARLRAFADDRTLRFDGADSQMHGLDASLRYVAPNRRWTLVGWHQRRDFSNIVVSASSFRPVLDQYATPATGSGALLQLRAAPTLTLGADARLSDGEARERTLASGAVSGRRANGGRVREAALFAEQEMRRGRITFAASARLAAWQIDRLRSREWDAGGLATTDTRSSAQNGTALTGRASLVYDAPRWQARLSAYRGMRLPTLNELTRGFTVFPVTTRANPALAPEWLTGAELAVRVRPSTALTAGVTLFDNRLAGAIGNVTLAPTLRERQNLDAVRSRGIEADVAWRRGVWGLDAAASLLRARVEQPGPLDGLEPAQVPARSTSVTLYREGRRTRLSATLRHQSRAFEDDLNLDRLPAATTLDLVARHRLSPTLDLALRAENLLDARVVTRNQGGSIDLGTPRTLWLALSWAARPAPSPR